MSLSIYICLWSEKALYEYNVNEILLIFCVESTSLQECNILIQVAFLIAAQIAQLSRSMLCKWAEHLGQSSQQ